MEDNSRLHARAASALQWPFLRHRKKLAAAGKHGDAAGAGANEAADDRKRILIVSYHFYPDTAVGAKRVSELARYLCSQGHEVVVVSATSDRYIKDDPTLALDFPNLRCIRVPQPPKLMPALLAQLKRLRPRRQQGGDAAAAPAAEGAKPAGQETFSQRLRRFYLSLEWLVDDKKLWATMVAGRLAGFALDKPFDIVLSSGPPMSPHLAVWLARPALRGRWIIDMRDPWCDQDLFSEVQSELSRTLNRRFERLALEAADAVSATTRGYARVLRERYRHKQDQIHLILNGFDGEAEASAPPQGRLALLYAGSLYYNRDPFPLLRAIHKLVNRPDVERERVSFRLVGYCDTWNGQDLGPWIARHQLEDCVSVHPPVSPAEVRRLMAESNVLVNFAQGQPMQIPAKMFEYIAARRDMLLMAEPDSDSAWVGGQAGCALVVPPGDQPAIDAAVAELYEKYVRSPRHSDFDLARLMTYSREVQNARFLDLLAGEPAVRQEAGL
jgi:glycosyltransferase involved in cell wall biosynthesis